MKIYFAASIRGGRDDIPTYVELIKLLQNYGTVLTEHIGDQKLDKLGEISISDVNIHDRDMWWLLRSDIIIAEVTNPSLGVGYEIGRAIENNKKVVCLYKKNKNISAMILGSANIISYDYDNINSLKKIVNNIFKDFNG